MITSMRERSPESAAGKESLESKKERLLHVFKSSQEIFSDPNRPLSEGAILVRREHKGQIENLSGLVVLSISENEVELGSIEEDGEIGPSAFMTWDEIVDAKQAVKI